MAKAKKQQPTKTGSQQISTGWFCVYQHKGSGNFSFKSEYDENRPVTLVLINSGDSIKIEINNSNAVQLNRHRCRGFFTNGLPAHFSCEGSGRWDFFEIKISLKVLKELPTSISSMWQVLKKKTDKKKTAAFTDHNFYYTGTIRELMRVLIVQQFKDPAIQTEYLHLKMKEILLFIIDEPPLDDKLNSIITTKQYQLAFKAQQFLQKQKTGNSFTTISLAENLGTNETTLKQAFKKVTGTSMYQFYMEKQMQLAQQLLLKGYPVSKVAAEVGYSVVAHFSHQFKKRYGVNPQHIKTIPEIAISQK